MLDIKRFLCVLIFLLFTFPVGYSLDQKSDTTEIILFEFREGFFDIPFYLDTISSTQYFTYKESASDTRCLYFQYGPYQCYFYAEPGINYSVKLPDLSGIDPEWRENPYFQPYSLHCEIEREHLDPNNKELNAAIREFDSEYEPFLSKQALRYYNTDYAKTKLDSFISSAYKDISVSDPEYFNHYREYRKALLFYHGNQHDLENLFNKYLLDKPLSFNIPSYRLFFSLSMGNYFEYLRRKEGFENIYSTFSTENIRDIKSYLRKDNLLQNNTILEMILLKQCYNAWYNDQLKKTKILNITDSIGIQTNNPVIRTMADFLKRNFTFLQPGYKAEEIHVIDIDGDSVNLDAENRRFIYLGFCDLSSLECIKEIEYLKYLYSKHNKYIEIISVLKAESREQLLSLREDERVKWKIVDWQEWPGIAETYEIKAVPSFFLIDRDGKVLQNPARNPSANFEYELFLLLRKRGEV